LGIFEAVAFEYGDCELLGCGVVAGEIAVDEGLAGLADGALETAAEIGGDVGCAPGAGGDAKDIKDFRAEIVGQLADRFIIGGNRASFLHPGG